MASPESCFFTTVFFIQLLEGEKFNVSYTCKNIRDHDSHSAYQMIECRHALEISENLISRAIAVQKFLGGFVNKLPAIG